jgi:putative flippase GtrA
LKDTKAYQFARNNKHEAKRFVKFAIVGFSGLIVDYTVLNILAHVFDLPSWIAVAGGFIVAALNNFVWNRLWVYPESRHTPKRKQLPVFFAVNFVGLLINEVTVFLLENPIAALLRSDVLGLNGAKAIGAVIVMFWNFIVNRLVTFRNVKTVPATDDNDDDSIASAL